MNIAKRIFLFFAVNVLIITTISIVFSVLGIAPYLNANGINYVSLIIFCLIWGFGGAFISLALSRILAKWMMGVKVIPADTHEPVLRKILDMVYDYCRQAGLEKMPQVGIYESPDMNAFATGPTRSRSLVAVSTGLLNAMSENEVRGVIAHEVSHIANGDMVTMTLIQGLVNAFALFLSRIIAFVISQFVHEKVSHLVFRLTTLVLDILLTILGSIVVFYFSRQREFRADSGAAKLAGRDSMISALRKLQATYELARQEKHTSLATMKISGKTGGLMALFASHPPLEIRIQRLQ